MPVLFTTIFGFFGAHAVTLWIVFCRAVGLYALYLAYVLGARSGATDRWSAAGPIAGVLAAVAVVLMVDWIHYMFRETSEPLTVAAALLWLDWHLRGCSLLGLSAGTALALMRPESSALLVPYAIWCLWRLPGVWRRVVVLAELLLIPVAWLLPPWLASHTPFMAANQAKDFMGNRGLDVYTIALHRAGFVLVWPVIAAALVMTLIALWRRDWLIVRTALACVTYVAIVEVMTIHGYPGLARFFLPAGAIVCVLAGAGVVHLAALAIPVGGRPGATIAACGLIASAAPFCASPITAFGLESHDSTIAVSSYHALVIAARRAGGRPAILPCRHSIAAVNHDEQPSMAWALDVPLDRIHGVTYRRSSVRRPMLGFFAPRNATVGGSPTHLLPGLHKHQVLRQQIWRVLRITRHHDTRLDDCVGLGGLLGHSLADAEKPQRF